MIEAVSIAKALESRPVFRGRRPDSPEAEVGAAFATLAPFGNGKLFAGSFVGDSAWERHPHGDELVHVLAGATRLTVLDADGSATVLDMSAGTVTVVPRNRWHRFEAPDGVTLMTATPLPTDHSLDDPRTRR